jgi:hypothetical protein
MPQTERHPVPLVWERTHSPDCSGGAAIGIGSTPPMESETALATLFVLLFFALHLGSRRLEHLPPRTRSLIMSVAGGVAAAYVFLHLLPDLGQYGAAISPALAGNGDGLGVYLLALLGVLAFFGIERLVVHSEEKSQAAGGEREVGPFLFWVHIGVFACNSFVIGMLLVDRAEATVYQALHAVALALHFIANDHALRLRHDRLHQRHGRWALAVAVLLGWAAGVMEAVPAILVNAMFAFVAGGIVFNVFKEELPSERGGSFIAFAGGAASYAGLLIIASIVA